MRWATAGPTVGGGWGKRWAAPPTPGRGPDPGSDWLQLGGGGTSGLGAEPTGSFAPLPQVSGMTQHP